MYGFFVLSILFYKLSDSYGNKYLCNNLIEHNYINIHALVHSFNFVLNTV